MGGEEGGENVWERFREGGENGWGVGIFEKGGGGEGREGMCVLLNYQMVYCIEQHVESI